MEFKDTGLPQDRALEQAFKRGYTAMMESLPMALEEYNAEAEGMAAHRMAMLDNIKGRIPDEKYESYLEQIDSQREMMLKAGPVIVRRNMDQHVMENIVHAAQVMAEQSLDGAVAILLVPCVRSPLDIRRIGETFGASVETLLVETIHLEVYADESATEVPRVSPQGRSVSLARMVGELNHQMRELERVLKSQPGARVSIEDGVMQESFDKYAPYWGNDPKLDARFVSLFNGLAEKASSPFRIGADAQGNIVLEQGIAMSDTLDLKKGKKGPRPKGPGDLI